MTICGLPFLNTGTHKVANISNNNSSFNWVHSLHTELMNASRSTNIFTIHGTTFPPMTKLFYTLI